LLGLLAACSDNHQTVETPPSWSVNGLTYAYPYVGQKQIAPTAPVVLHFSAPLRDTVTATLASHFTITGPGNTAVAFTLSQVNNNQGVVLTPTAKLTEGSNYTVNWSNLGITGGVAGSVVQPLPNGITFATRNALTGPKALVSSGAFAVARSLPDDSTLPLMDFSSLRLQLTQPVERSSLIYGQSLRLEDAIGALVPATILLSDRLLTVDPVHDMTPGKTYTLKLTSAVKSIYGEALNPGSYSAFAFTPQDSSPRTTQVLQVPDSSSGTIISSLTGAAINNVPIQSTLLGNDSASQSSGNLYAELAFIPHFPNNVPLTIRRGNVLNGSSVQVKIAGKVPAGLDTGAITVNIISDASGYMVPNPYSKLVTAPRLVMLTMDISLGAANSSANGAFTQNIQHVQVVGTAIVKDNKLTMDAVGVAELQVLGLDQASGVLSFHLEGYQDQTTAPPQVANTTPPSLQSWVPGNEAARARPGDPIILNFTEPLDANSAQQGGAITLLMNGVAQPASISVDGQSVVVKPQTALMHNASYTVQLTQNITDLAGNPLDQAYNLAFSLSALTFPGSRSPIVLSTYPGYPCATSPASHSATSQGRCLGGASADDVLPVPGLPLNRSISVHFSQNMNPASIKLGSSCSSGSFRVEAISPAGTCTGVIPGRLELQPFSLKFTPDTPWVAGQLYHYVLGSNGNTSSSAATCDGTQSLCGVNGLPLQTQLLAPSAASATTATAGGPSMDIWFTGAASSPSIFQSLRSLPTSDVNANFIHDAGEAEATDNGSGTFSIPNGGQIIPDPTHTPPYSGLISGFNVGCASGSCPPQGFSFASSALDADVVGFDATLGGVKVLIYPTALITSSFNIYATATGATINNPIVSGPMVIRLRYAANPGNPSVLDQPITGVIKSTVNGPVLSGSLQGYLDLPELDPRANLLGFIPTSLTHNLHSYPLNIAVSGPVSFTTDGRMLVTLANTAAVPVMVSTSALGAIPAGNLYITIPAGSLTIQGVSAPIKQ
jgi:hypothetical protein